MFADYGAYGRSLRKRIKKTVKKVSKVPFKAVKVVTKPAFKIAGEAVKVVAKPVFKIADKAVGVVSKVPIVGKSVSKIAGGATGIAGKIILKRKQTAEEEEVGIQRYEDEYGNPVDANGNTLAQVTIGPQVGVQTAVQTVIPYQTRKPTPQEIESMKQAAIMMQQGISAQAPQIQETNYRPQQQHYKAPTQQQQEYYDKEQSQPEESYYSENRMPVKEGSVMNDEFIQEESKDAYQLPEGDFGGLGLDEDTVLLLKEATPNVQAAIDAGNKYVDSIQGKPNSTAGAIVKDIKTNTEIPTWIWFALGGAFILAATSHKAKRNKKR